MQVYYPYFTYKELGAQRSKVTSKITLLVSGRAGFELKFV